MTGLGILLLGAGGLALACYVSYHAGKSDQKARDLHDTLEAGRRAALARDRLRRDPGYARRLRGRFSR